MNYNVLAYTKRRAEQIHSSDVNLEPEYQRGKHRVALSSRPMLISSCHSSPEVVWPETKQIGLIDSIFRNFYIPPVIFVEFRPIFVDDVHGFGKATKVAATRAVPVQGLTRKAAVGEVGGDKLAEKGWHWSNYGL